MFVEKLITLLSTVELPAHNCTAEEIYTFNRFTDSLLPNSKKKLEDLIAHIVKWTPKKTAEELAAEKIEKAKWTAQQKAEQAAIKAKQKEFEAQAKAAKKAEETRKKQEEKERLAIEKAAAKLKADAEKKAKKIADMEEKQRQLQTNVLRVAQELESLLNSFRFGHVPKDRIERHFEELKTFKAQELYQIAVHLQAVGSLTEKSTKLKISKQIQDMILRVWKTSDNIHH